MRKLVYFIATSLDGFIAGPHGEVDFFPMQGDHITAQIVELPETLPKHVRAMLNVPDAQARFDTVLMGWDTYAPAFDAGITDPYAPMASVVFSRRRPATEVGGLRVTSDDPVAVVRALKAQPGRDIWLCGGGQLAAALVDELDELILKVNPVVVGEGLPVLTGGFRPQSLALQSRRDFTSGVTWLSYSLTRS